MQESNAVNQQPQQGRNFQLDKILAYVFGIVFISAILALAFFDRNPSNFAVGVYKTVLALAAAGVAAMIPGFIDVNVQPFVRSGGAIAVFVIVFFFSDKVFPQQSSVTENVEITVEAIVAEIERFKTDNSSYPETLGELDIIDLIEKVGSNRIEYAPDKEKGYTLRYAGNDNRMRTSDDRIYHGESVEIPIVESSSLDTSGCESIPITFNAQNHSGLGFMRYDLHTDMIVSAQREGSRGPENATFNVRPDCLGKYLLRAEMATAVPHLVEVYEDITPQKQPKFSLTVMETGGYGPEYSTWIPIGDLLLDDKKTTRLTFHAKRGTNERIPHIRAIRLTHVDYSFEPQKDEPEASGYTVYLYSPEGQDKELDLILRRIGSKISQEGYNVTGVVLKPSDFPVQADIGAVTIGYHSEERQVGLAIRSVVEESMAGSNIRFHDFTHSAVSNGHIVVYVNLQPIENANDNCPESLYAENELDDHQLAYTRLKYDLCKDPHIDVRSTFSNGKKVDGDTFVATVNFYDKDRNPIFTFSQVRGVNPTYGGSTNEAYAENRIEIPEGIASTTEHIVIKHSHLDSVDDNALLQNYERLACLLYGEFCTQTANDIN